MKRQAWTRGLPRLGGIAKSLPNPHHRKETRSRSIRLSSPTSAALCQSDCHCHPSSAGRPGRGASTRIRTAAPTACSFSVATDIPSRLAGLVACATASRPQPSTQSRCPQVALAQQVRPMFSTLPGGELCTPFSAPGAAAAMLLSPPAAQLHPPSRCEIPHHPPPIFPRLLPPLLPPSLRPPSLSSAVGGGQWAQLALALRVSDGCRAPAPAPPKRPSCPAHTGVSVCSCGLFWLGVCPGDGRAGHATCIMCHPPAACIGT